MTNNCNPDSCPFCSWDYGCLAPAVVVPDDDAPDDCPILARDDA